MALRGGVEGRSGVDGKMSGGGLASLEKTLLALERRSRVGEIGSDGRAIDFLRGVLCCTGLAVRVRFMESPSATVGRGSSTGVVTMCGLLSEVSVCVSASEGICGLELRVGESSGGREEEGIAGEARRASEEFEFEAAVKSADDVREAASWA